MAVASQTAMTLAPLRSKVSSPWSREPDLPLSDLVRARSVTLGEQGYVEHARDGRVLSFRQLEGSMERWRAKLSGARARGLTTIGLAISDPLAFADAFVGAMAAGFWVAPLDPSMPWSGKAGLAAAMTRTGAEVVVGDRPAVAGVGEDWVELHRLGGVDDGPVTRPGATAPRLPDAGGVILSSSGTTGTPKVVRLGLDQLLYTARCVASHLELGPDDRGFNPLPLFHINAEVVGLLATMVSGAGLVLDDKFHRTAFWELMELRSITWINAVPAIISRLGAPGPEEKIPTGIRFIRSASAPLPIAAAGRFEDSTGIPVIETYGMTEAASQITAHPLGVPRRPGSVGVPVGVELRIVDQAEPVGGVRPPAEGQSGHVEIRGPSVIATYVGDAHQDRFDSDGWLRTGDLGHVDDDGFVYLDARTDDVINRGGEKVFPREIEEIIGADPMVAATAVVGREDPELGQVPVAFVVLRGPEDPTGGDAATFGLIARETTIRVGAALEANLVRAKRPVALCVVHALPAGATGKVRRRELDTAAVPVLYTYGLR